MLWRNDKCCEEKSYHYQIYHCLKQKNYFKKKKVNYTAQEKLSFPLRISPVNVTKSAVNCRFGHIYRRNPKWKTSIFVQWYQQLSCSIVIKSINRIKISNISESSCLICEKIYVCYSEKACKTVEVDSISSKV